MTGYGRGADPSATKARGRGKPTLTDVVTKAPRGGRALGTAVVIVGAMFVVVASTTLPLRRAPMPCVPGAMYQGAQVTGLANATRDALETAGFAEPDYVAGVQDLIVALRQVEGSSGELGIATVAVGNTEQLLAADPTAPTTKLGKHRSWQNRQQASAQLEIIGGQMRAAHTSILAAGCGPEAARFLGTIVIAGDKAMALARRR